jgi:hypothetical protein
MGGQWEGNGRTMGGKWVRKGSAFASELVKMKKLVKNNVLVCTGHRTKNKLTLSARGPRMPLTPESPTAP